MNCTRTISKALAVLLKRLFWCKGPLPILTACSLDQLRLRENYTLNAMLLLLLTTQFFAVLHSNWFLVHFKCSFAEQATNQSHLAQTWVAFDQNWLMSVAELTNSAVGKSKPIKGATRRPLSNLTSLHPGATVFTQHLRRIYSSLHVFTRSVFTNRDPLSNLTSHPGALEFILNF